MGKKKRDGRGTSGRSDGTFGSGLGKDLRPIGKRIKIPKGKDGPALKRRGVRHGRRGNHDRG